MYILAGGGQKNPTQGALNQVRHPRFAKGIYLIYWPARNECLTLQHEESELLDSKELMLNDTAA